MAAAATAGGSIVVLGAGGQVGSALFSGSADLEDGWVGLDLADLDITRPGDVERRLASESPSVVLNLAAWTDVDGAEAAREEAFRVNRDGAGHVADACRSLGAALVHVSTDYVFDGTSDEPYPESAAPRPLNAYGESKLAGERLVLDRCPDAVVVRTSAVYGCHGRNFVKTMLRLGLERDTLRVVADQRTAPTQAGDLADALAEVCGRLQTRQAGRIDAVLHWCGRGSASWHELAVAVLDEARDLLPIRTRVVEAIDSETFGAAAPRPRYSVLDCARADALGLEGRPWLEAVRDTVRSLAAEQQAGA